MSRLARFLPPVQLSLVFPLVFALALATGWPLFNDPDAAWHITSGDLIRDSGVPFANPWTFVPDQKWYLISWLWDVGVSLIHSLGGTKAVFLLTHAMVALTASVVACHAMRRGETGAAMVVFTALLFAFCFNKFTMSRPQLAGYLFVACFHFLLWRTDNDRHYRRLFWLPIIMLAWMNMHGSFVSGFTVLGAYGLAALIRRQWQWFGRLAAISVLCALIVPAFNPYGPGIYFGVERTLHNAMNQYIEEWIPFDFATHIGVSTWMALFAVLSIFRAREIPLADKWLSAFWFVSMMVSIRHASIFMVVTFPMMAADLQSIVSRARRPRFDRLEALALRFNPALRIGMMLVALTAVTLNARLTERFENEHYYLVSRGFDFRPAAAWVGNHLEGKRVLNDYNFGGTLLYVTKGAFPVFVDGRAGSAYSEEVLLDYRTFEQFHPGWEKVLDKYQIDAIAMQNSRPFVQFSSHEQIQSRWQLEYRDEVVSVFVRKASE